MRKKSKLWIPAILGVVVILVGIYYICMSKERIPEGLTEESYGYCVQAINVVEKFQKGKMSYDDALTEIILLTEKLNVCIEEEDDSERLKALYGVAIYVNGYYTALEFGKYEMLDETTKKLKEKLKGE